MTYRDLENFSEFFLRTSRSQAAQEKKALNFLYYNVKMSQTSKGLEPKVPEVPKLKLQENITKYQLKKLIKQVTEILKESLK